MSYPENIKIDQYMREADLLSSNLELWERELAIYQEVAKLVRNNMKAYYVKFMDLLDLVRRYEVSCEFKNGGGQAYFLALKGGMLRGKGKLEEAVRCFERAIELEPRNVLNHGAKGMILHELQKYEEAITFYDKCTEVLPSYYYSYYLKGQAFRELGKYKEAIELYNKAIKLHSNDDGSYRAKAEVLDQLGEYEQALENCNEFIKVSTALFPEAEIRELKNSILKKLGRHDEVEKYLLEEDQEVLNFNSKEFDISLVKAWTFIVFWIIIFGWMFYHIGLFLSSKLYYFFTIDPIL